ncbi:hypothetical protein D9M70_567560 [compost metagenome]
MQPPNAVHDILRQGEVNGAKIGLQLFHRCRADDDGRHERPRQAEGDCHLSGIEAVLACKLHITGNRRLLVRREAAAEVAVDREAGARRLGAVQILAAEQSGCERRIGKQAHVLVMR